MFNQQNDGLHFKFFYAKSGVKEAREEAQRTASHQENSWLQFEECGDNYTRFDYERTGCHEKLFTMSGRI